MHALRHYYASLLIRYGESVKTVQARLGHASAAETLDTYSHLWPDSDDRTRAAVDSVLGQSPGDRLRNFLGTNWGLQRCADHVSAGQRREAEELACRPGSVPGDLAAGRGATIHLRPPLPAASCGLPAYSGGPPSDVRAPVALTSLRAAGFLTLLRAGFAEPTGSPRPLVVSCTTVSPLPARPRPTRRSVLCGTFPRVTPGGCCPPPCPAEPGPSSTLSRHVWSYAAVARPAPPHGRG